jgi:hypothetical protein
MREGETERRLLFANFLEDVHDPWLGRGWPRREIGRAEWRSVVGGESKERPRRGPFVVKNGRLAYEIANVNESYHTISIVW